MEISVTQAAEADAQEIAKVLTEAKEYKLSHDDMSWGVEPYKEDKIAENITRGDVYIARIDREVVGSLQLKWEDEKIWGEQPPNAGYVHQLAIGQDFHGKNIGEQMIIWAENEAKSHGREFLRLDCPAANKELRSYYENHGFELVATRPNPMFNDSLTSYYQRKI